MDWTLWRAETEIEFYDNEPFTQEKGHLLYDIISGLCYTKTTHIKTNHYHQILRNERFSNLRGPVS